MSNNKCEIVKTKYYGYSIPKLGDNEVEIQDVTVCLIMNSYGDYARGITVFNSVEDIYNITVGQWEAKQSALRALKGRHIQGNCFKRAEAISTLIRCKCPWTKKGERNPELAPFEKRLLFGRVMKNTIKEKLVNVFDSSNVADNGLKDAHVYFSQGWYKRIKDEL